MSITGLSQDREAPVKGGSLNIPMRFRHIISEEVFAAAAFGYHRTKNVQNAVAIGESGFRAGDGNTYGKGIYLTYDFDDQQDSEMRRKYGRYIIRSKVNIADFLIFDEDVAEKVYGSKGASLEAQFRRFGIPEQKLKDIRHYDHWNDEQERLITAPQALRMARWRSLHEDQARFRGMIFTGEQDGRVIVAFDPRSVVPFAFALASDLTKTFEQLRWRRYEKPPFNPPVEQTPFTDADAAMRYMKSAGYTPLRRGVAGGVFIRPMDGDNIVVMVSPKRYADNKVKTMVAAFASRTDPRRLMPGHRVDPTLPIMSEFGITKAGHRLLHREFEGRVPIAEFLSEVDRRYAALDDLVKRNEAFGRALLARLVPPGTNISGGLKNESRNYGFDRLILQAETGPMLEVEQPYGFMIYGKVHVGRGLELGFNAGREGEPSLETAYRHLLDSVDFDRRMLRVNRIRFGGSNQLSTEFAADLDRAIWENG